MKEIKIFELHEPNPIIAYQVMSIIAGSRCAGKETDPDSGEGWDKYEKYRYFDYQINKTNFTST